MKLENFEAAVAQIVDERHVDRTIVEDALKEAIVKAFRKQIEVSDALAEVVVEDEELKLYRLFEVVEEVEDDALQVQLDELEEGSPLQVGEFLREPHSIDQLGRAAALLAKQVLKQKIREAEKQAVYDEYIDMQDEMIFGEVESVEERFVIVNLGKALAVMPKAQQMSNEIYQEGQRLRVMISEVIRDTKGAQVIVSRADPNLVKRLFEKEVPEIYEGVVEIRAIARDAGERTKMAVYSNNPDIDPIGACIGPRGSRVQVVIEELKGEKIDIFEWSENTIELIKNALAPAVITAIFPSQERRGLVVVVDDKQLSLAIGKRGKNARLAVKLTKERIDIKSISEVEEMGLDYMALMEEYQKELDIILAQKKAKQAQARLDALAQLQQEQEEEIEETQEIVDLDEETEGLVVCEEEVEDLSTTKTIEEEPEVEEIQPVEEPEHVEEASTFADEIDVQPEPEPEVKAEPKKEKRTIRQRQEYVSKFEELADASRSQQQQSSKRKKRRSNDGEMKRVNTAELLAELEYEIKPTYSEEELQDLDYKDDEWYDDDIDFDEFDEFYDN